MAAELVVTQWWKTPNLKEDEEKRKAVWTVSERPYRGHGDSSFPYPSKYKQTNLSDLIGS
jgi:hypothetical protein